MLYTVDTNIEIRTSAMLTFVIIVIFLSKADFPTPNGVSAVHLIIKVDMNQLKKGIEHGHLTFTYVNFQRKHPLTYRMLFEIFITAIRCREMSWNRENHCSELAQNSGALTF